MKQRIFLVEDDVNFGLVLKSYLEINDFDVTHVMDGKDAVPTFKKGEYDQSLKEDVLKGFDVGADDYVTKPFDSDVLLMKIKAILKRSDKMADGTEMDDIVNIGKFEYHTRLRQLKYNDETQKLSPREGELLKMLYLHRNKVMDRNEALRSIWGDDNYFNARSMDVYITKLRKYLKNDTDLQINNVHSSGFILVMPD